MKRVIGGAVFVAVVVIILMLAGCGVKPEFSYEASRYDSVYGKADEFGRFWDSKPLSEFLEANKDNCLLYTSPSPRD